MSWQEILRHARQGATKTGIPLEVYLAHVAAGEARCSGCSRAAGEPIWHRLERFDWIPSRGVRSNSCGVGKREEKWKAARRWARNHGHTGSCLDEREGCYTRWGRLDHRHCACGEPMGVNAQACRRCRQERPWAA